MYTISKGPSKIVAKRRGMSQNYEKFETIREINKKHTDIDNTDFSCVPKPVFQTTKKSSSQLSKVHQKEEFISPQHKELVNYIHESWNMVVAQNPYDIPGSPDSTSSSTSSLSSNSSTNSTNSVYYVDPPSPILNDFQPFDLESWWGRRLFNNITKSL